MDKSRQTTSHSGLRWESADPDSAVSRWCLARYYAELQELFEGGFDPAKSAVADSRAFAPPRGAFLVARLDGRPVGCGAVTLVSPAIGYLKRMWVDESVRGLGLGRQLLQALEAAARGLGCSVVQLETHRTLTAAIQLYRTSGFTEVAAFNDEFYAHHWFEKNLEPATPSTF